MKAKHGLDRRTAKELEGFLRRFLTDKHARLKESMRSVMLQRCRSEGGRSTDSVDQAAETLHDEIQVALMDRQSHQLAQIESALRRLSLGEYGFCQECGEFMGLARLRALPFAQRCVPCEERAELQSPAGRQSLAAIFATRNDDD